MSRPTVTTHDGEEKQGVEKTDFEKPGGKFEVKITVEFQGLVSFDEAQKLIQHFDTHDYDVYAFGGALKAPGIESDTLKIFKILHFNIGR